MALSGAVIALAPNYLIYMIGRALIGVVVGGFWSISTATAMQLVPAHQVRRALAIFNGGNALATVIAAPLGAWLGDAIGWRGAFFCLVPVAMVQFSIALGSTAGGLLFDHSGYRSMLAASAATLLVVAVLIFLAARAETTRSYEQCSLQGATP